jgi:hypothetical protein
MKRHSLDPISFVFGLFFLALGGAFLTGSATLVGINRGWIWPLVAVMLGLALALSGRRRGHIEQQSGMPPVRQPEASAVETPADPKV